MLESRRLPWPPGFGVFSDETRTSMSPTLLYFLAALFLLLQLAILWLAFRRPNAGEGGAGLLARLERLEQQLAAAFAQGRAETGQQSRELRGEIALRLEQSAAAGREAFEKRLDAIDSRLGHGLIQMKSAQDQTFEAIRAVLDRRLGEVHDAGRTAVSHQHQDLQRGLKVLGEMLHLGLAKAREEQERSFGAFRQNFGELSRASLEQLDRVRGALDHGMARMQQSNETRLEEMRRIVDEKLQDTLERRLGQSFGLISDRLEQVHRGLGEMQSLAHGVGDLKRLMSNVKVRGTWGEIQLGSLLEQMLAPGQYAANVETRAGSGEYVEFAIRLPGQSGSDVPVWLPIDAKLHQEDYQRLLEAQDGGDPEAAASAGKGLERAFRLAAKTIAELYLQPPATTDFAILFVPVEGLYAEILRRPGLIDGVQRDFRVTVAGPTTLCALLSSLQMGFRTLAIERRSSEVWQVLGAVKTELERFGGMLDKARKKIQEAGNVIGDAQTRSRAVGRKLRAVQELPAGDASELLGLEAGAPAEPSFEEKGESGD